MVLRASVRPIYRLCRPRPPSSRLTDVPLLSSFQISFEKLRGTREATVNSRQYSEKAYVLTRHFILHALTHPPLSFTDEIRHYYLVLGRLGGVIESTRKLMDASSAAPVTEAEVAEGDAKGWEVGDGVGRLTMGGMLPLKRTMEGLEKAWSEWKEQEGKMDSAP